jgi:hypothetical protein
LVPEIVTGAPPASGPDPGVIDVIVGGGLVLYVKAPMAVTVPLAVDPTTTSAGPAVPGGVRQVMSVRAVLTVRLETVRPPTRTVIVGWKLPPSIVSSVPPRSGPPVGEIDPMIGGGPK